jgi:hypothetical protein
MRRFLPLLAVLLATLPGCITKYVVVSQFAKPDLEVVIFAADPDRGSELLDALEELGYDSDQNHVASPVNEESTIRWGGASEAQVDEIAAFVRGRYGVELERDRAFKPSDKSVFIALPEFAAVAGPGTIERSDIRVVVFTDGRERGDSLLESLESLGYSNDGSYVTDEPNDGFNVKWGAAPETMIDEIVALADERFSVELDRQNSFEPDDKDVFINLPFGTAIGAPDRSDFEITVFCDDRKQGQKLLRQLARFGYTNDGNEVLAGPNDDFNVKYGALPDALLDELAGAIENEFKSEFRRSGEFDKTSRQVFINLPREGERPGPD